MPGIVKKWCPKVHVQKWHQITFLYMKIESMQDEKWILNSHPIISYLGKWSSNLYFHLVSFTLCHSSLISLTTHSRAPLIINYYVFNFSTKKNCSILMYSTAKQTRLHFVHSPCLWWGLFIPLFLNSHVLKLSHMKLSLRYFYHLTITFLYVYYV